MSVSQDEEKFDRLFQELNVVLSKPVLEKCIQIAMKYNLNAEAFFDEWFAYTTTNLYGAPPTIPNLNGFEQSRGRFLQAEEKKNRTENLLINKRTVIIDHNNATEKHKDDEINLFDTLLEGETMHIQTEESQENSKISTPSQRYTERSDSGAIELNYGTINSSTFQSDGNQQIQLKIENQTAYLKYILMLPHLRVNYLHRLIQWTSDAIISHHNLSSEEEEVTDEFAQVARIKPEWESGALKEIIGRIFCELKEKIDVDSVKRNVFLECYRLLNSPKLLSGKKVKLHFDKLKKYSIFRGQIVVVQGELILNDFYVHKMYTNAPLLKPIGEKDNLKTPLHVMVACGPFTLPTNLLFEPLDDLLNEVLTKCPDLLILVGPLIDRDHPQVLDLPEMPKNFFRTRINYIISRLECSGIKLLFVSSHRENHLGNIFPTKLYKIGMKNHPNYGVHFAPDPTTIDLNGINLCITSVDIVFKMMSNELYKSNEGIRSFSNDRISRIISHLMNQRNIYPLVPSNSDLTIDFNSLLSNGLLRKKPDIMILPSKLGNFVKVINGCVCINPETLVKGNVSGKYCHIEVRPGVESITERISCQVKKI